MLMHITLEIDESVSFIIFLNFHTQRYLFEFLRQKCTLLMSRQFDSLCKISI